MKKYIAKILFTLSLLSFLGVLFSIFSWINEPSFFRESEQLMLAIYSMMFGLFLGLSRIIELLEQR